MPIDNVILDFDGTLTDIKKEGEIFLKHYSQEFARRLGIDPSNLMENYGIFKEIILRHPELGWEINNQDICLAAADGYILPQAAFQQMLRKIKQGDLDYHLGYDKSKVPENEAQFLLELYVATAAAMPIHPYFRQGLGGTQRFLDDLMNCMNITIVSNSNPDKIALKLANLNSRRKPSIIGHAKKLFNMPDFEEVPESVQPEGFPRKVLLRRKFYYESLQMLAKDKGFTPETTAVVGDIYEFDLALPEHLGYRVVQIRTPFTPQHEVEYNRAKNHFAENFDEVFPALR